MLSWGFLWVSQLYVAPAIIERNKVLGPFSCVPSICSGHRETNYFHLFGNPIGKINITEKANHNSRRLHLCIYVIRFPG